MLSAPHRLKGRKVFNDLFRTGKTFSNDLLMVKIGAGEKGAPTQFGFGASLKFSKKAVERNRVKRWMREAVRAKIAEIEPGWRAVLVINPKASVKVLSLPRVREKVENLLKKAKIL